MVKKNILCAFISAVDGVSEVYSELERNPLIYRISADPFMKELNYHEAKVPEQGLNGIRQ